jgi:Zn-dependent protease
VKTCPETTVLAEPEPTSLDLRFRLFGVSVRVHPFFWLVSAFLGWNLVPGAGNANLPNLGYLLAWIAVVFVSILLHEFGHVFMGRAFGSRGHIVLQAMGGVAVGSGNVPRTWQRILVLAAGPGIQLVFLLVTWLLSPLLLDALPGETADRVQPVVDMLLMINLVWPIANLLPLFPLDGGQITREAATAISPRHGSVVALTGMVVVEAAFALHILACALDLPLRTMEPFASYAQGLGKQINAILRISGFMAAWNALMVGLLAFSTYQTLQAEKRQRPGYYDDEMPWER